MGGAAHEGRWRFVKEPNHLLAGSARKTVSPSPMNCWTSICPQVRSLCTSICCVTQTAGRTNAIRARRPSQRGCISHATPSPSTFGCWKNEASSSRNTRRSSRSAVSRRTAICSTRSSRCTRPRSAAMSGSSPHWTRPSSGTRCRRSCQRSRVHESREARRCSAGDSSGAARPCGAATPRNGDARRARLCSEGSLLLSHALLPPRKRTAK